MLKKIVCTALLVGLAAGVSIAVTQPDASQPPFTLTDAAPSPDVLVHRLLSALEKQDAVALHSLRVSEREYRELIAPGTVPQGQPPRQSDAKVSEFYWRMLDAKSRDLGNELFKRFGGRKLVFESFEFTKSPQQYAWYRAEGEVRVHVRNEKGDQATVPAGWVAEVDGRYKFIGLNWND